MFSLIKILPILLVLTGGAYGYHNYTINSKESQITQLKLNVNILQNNVIRLESALERSEQSVKDALENFKKQQMTIGEMTAKNETLSRERDEYLSIFKRHDLTNLARVKPGLIEPRINNGTKTVFRQIEQDSKEIVNAND